MSYFCHTEKQGPATGHFKTKIEIMTTIIAIAAFIIAAIVGWAIAECKANYVTYTNNEQEDTVLRRQREELERNGYKELNIRDVVRTIATTGYSAV